MIAIIFLVACAVAGVAVTYAVPWRFRLEERVFMGVPLGLAAGTLLSFGLALVIGFSAGSVAVISALLLAGAAIAISQFGWWPAFNTEMADLRQRVRTREFLAFAAVYGVLGVLLGVLLWNAIFTQDGALYAAFLNVWGDWNQHLSQVTSFAYGENYPPVLSTMSGQRLTYPFMTNWLSASLVKGGLPLLEAMKLPVVLLGLSALGMIMTFTRVVAGRGAALLAPWLFFLGGGLGFINAIKDFMGSGQPLGYFLSHQPHNYTQTFSDTPITNINWVNPIYAYVVPQRAFIFGLPIVLTVLTLLYLGLTNRRRGLMLAAGLVACVLPLVHTHGLLFLGFITPVLFVLTRRSAGKTLKTQARFWLAFVGPILLIAIPQFLWLTYGLSSSKFIRVQLGWITGQDNVLWFWLKNIGLFLPLLGVALYRFRQQARPLVALTCAAGAVFLLANVFVFQPWDWDNTKLFVYWYVVSIPLVALLLVSLASRGKAWQGGIAVLVLCLTLAGSLDVTKALNRETGKVGMFEADAFRLADHIKQNTAPDAVFLTAQHTNNPVSGLSGRRIVMGYTGWLWSYGLDYYERERDIIRIYQAEPGIEERLAQYDISYVAIGPSERTDKEYRLNENYFQQNYPVWYQRGSLVIYDVRQQTARATSSH